MAVYGECMRNHALDVLGYSKDGCGLYEPTAQDGFACASCGCHRSFHRKSHVELPRAEEQPLVVVALEAPPQPQRRPRITQEQSEQIRAVVEANNWKMFREYSGGDVVRICSEIGIHRMTLKSWISTHRRRRLNKIEDHA